MPNLSLLTLEHSSLLRVSNNINESFFFRQQAAIKMMTKVAEHEENRDVIIANLADIMPGLLKVHF
jgi:hypothetical protein